MIEGPLAGSGPGVDAAAATPASPRGPTRISRGQVVSVGTAGGVAAGVAMAATLMAIAEIASEPTFAPGIDSSTWTPLTGIAAFLLGTDAFHGDFDVLPVAFGLAVHLTVAAVLGAAGLGFIVASLGARPGLPGATLLGFVYGLFLQVFLLSLVINGIQGELTVYQSLPPWGWWVAHAAYGTAFGLAGALLLGSRPFAR